MDVVMKDEEIIKRIYEILFETPYFVCDQCYLRGSYANETYSIVSDIDLLVISRDFQDISFRKRKELLQKAMKEFEYKIEIDSICLSNNEYSKLVSEKRDMYCEERMVKIL